MPRAKRSLGQNFLIDPNLQRKIVEAIRPRSTDVVIEIGPGKGALTHLLAERVGRLVAIEKDDALARRLVDALAARDNVTIVHDDALETDIESIIGPLDRAKVIGNIPYNITSPLIFRLLEPEPRPQLLVLTVQREVADRITASPGTAEYGALTVGVRTIASVERLFTIPGSAFRPVPKVGSAVIRITPFSPPALTRSEQGDLRALTRATFGWRRKQLQRTLRDAPEYRLEPEQVRTLGDELGIDLRRRPETLDPESFIALSRALRRAGVPVQHTD